MKLRTCALVFCIFALFTFTARASDFFTAQTWFQRLPEADRHTITMMLIATGRYNGMSTGEFNHRIFNGLMGFQDSHAQQPTGILDDAAKRTLHTEGAQFLQKLGLREINHPVVSAKLFVPFKLIEIENRTPRGFAYEGKDAAVDFSYFPAIEIGLTELFNKLASGSVTRRITYKVARDNFFVVSGDTTERHFYSRFQSVPNGTVGFTFSWDDLAADGHGDRVAALMSNLFFSSNAAPVVAASPGSPTLSSVLSLPKGQVWLVLASRERFEDAVDFATRYGSPGVRVVKSMNGWFAVLDGPTDVDSGRAHIQSGTLVEPAYLSGGERFIETVWQRPKEQVATNAPAHPTEVVSSGSSVLVSQEGYLITNEHVIAGCASLNAVGIGKVIVAGQDKINDLALLKSNTKSSAEPLPLSTSPTRLGQEVIVVGYPLQGILGGLNVTNGIVSGLSGLGNNSTQLQFTAPIQPGNSGGALLDRSGALVGIVSSKLNDRVAFGSAGFVPQGVNFAVRKEVVQTFLSAQSVMPILAETKSERTIEDIADLARKSVFPLECLK